MNYKSKLKDLGYSDPSLESYLKSIDHFDLIEDAVAKRSFGIINQQRSHIINSHLKLVVKIAIDVYQLFRGSGDSVYDLMDLIQEGNIALIKCVDGFDLKRNIKFSTYMGGAVRNAMWDFIAANTGAINLYKSVPMKTLHYHSKDIEVMYDEGMTMDEIATNFGVTYQDLELFMNKLNVVEFQDTPVTDLCDELLTDGDLGKVPMDDDGNYRDENDALEGAYYYDDGRTLEDALIYTEEINDIRNRIDKFRKTLSSNNKYIFDNLIYEDNLTQQEAADHLKITRQAVQQACNRILTKAKKYFSVDDLKIF